MIATAIKKRICSKKKPSKYSAEQIADYVAKYCDYRTYFVLIDKPRHNKMTIKEAYMAMQYFLEQFYDRTGSDDVGGLLGDMLLTDNEETMDPGIWNDWIEAVKKVKPEQ